MWPIIILLPCIQQPKSKQLIEQIVNEGDYGAYILLAFIVIDILLSM